MGGGGSERITSQPLPVNLPPEIAPLVSQSAGQVGALQQAFPLGSLFQNLAQPITGLTDTERAILGEQVARAERPAISAPETAALTDINFLAGGPLGSSPATMAGMNAFERLTKPGLEQDAALLGLGRSGAVLEDVDLARTAAAVPLLQQEVQNRMGVLPILQGIGGTVADRERQDLATALGAAGAPREIADEINQAQFLDQMRRAQLTEGLTLGPLQIFGPQDIPPAPTIQRQTQPGIYSRLAKK